jgi:uncharacterized protein YggE
MIESLASRTLAAHRAGLPLLTLLALATPALAACSTPCQAATVSGAGDPAHRRTLTVTGTATVDLVPDCLDVSLTLSTEGASPKQVMGELRAKQAVLVKALLATGVAPGDVKLSGLSLSPTYDDSRRVIKGYVASIAVVASTKKLDMVGDIMEAASIAGTQNMSTTYRVNDLPSYKKKVRKLALDAAAEKARETAGALGTHLGHVAEVAESAGEYYSGSLSNSYQRSASGDSQLSPEMQPLTLSINVVYELE